MPDAILKMNLTTAITLNDSGEACIPTKNSNDLPKQVKPNTDASKAMRSVIVLAALRAVERNVISSFVGSDLEIYPDVGGAFSVCSGIRMCRKCKDLKQESFYCR